MSRTRAYLAVDIGGTKIEVGVVSDDREVLQRRRDTTPASGVWSVVAGLIDASRAWASDHDVDLIACGVGCGGPLNLATSTVSPLHIPEWRQFPLVQRVASHAGLVTVVDNDAKALVRAEWWHRVHSGSDVPRAMMSVVLGTGVGAGIIVEGRLLHGRTGNAGHIGHIIVEPEGNTCECGAVGCLEAHVSGRAIARRVGGAVELASMSVRDDVARLLGIAIASVAATVDVTDVTLGGSVALGFGQSLCAKAQSVAREHAGLSMIHDVSVALVADENDAPLLGAAGLAKYPSAYEADVLT